MNRQVKRYAIISDNWDYVESPTGGFIDRDDFAALEAECDALWSTYVALVDKLGIDTEKAKTADGKPSDVIVSYVDALRAENDRLRKALEHCSEVMKDPWKHGARVPEKKAESVRWGYRSLGYAEGWNACVDAMLAAPANPAERQEQEECCHEFVPFQSSCAKCGEPYDAAERQEPVASISWTNDDPEWKLKMLAEPAHPPVVPLKLYTSPQPSAEYVQVAEVMTGCIGKLNWLVMPNFKNGTKLYVEGGGDE